MDWFGAQLKTVCFVDGVGSVDCDLCVHVLRAADPDSAFRRALEIGSTHNTSYKNADNQTVEWRFAEVVTLDLLGSGDLDGREVHSVLTGEGTGEPLDTVYHPEDSQPGEASPTRYG